MNMAERTTIDIVEITRFSHMAATWWNPNGDFHPLHRFNPTRLAYIKEKICLAFNRDPLEAKPLQGLRILDIGCGGGLLCEPLARLGADIVGADASADNIEVAKIHAAENGLDIDYRITTIETLAKVGEKFNVILNMEVVEHVADVSLFMAASASVMKQNGLMFIATLNRTWKAWGLAIVAAEYILRWLPKGTHSYEKLLRPSELKKELRVLGLTIIDEVGVTYNPLTDTWNRSSDMSVNYILLACYLK
ncbi:MAG: 2-polyprenyl-6-hydroxyphenyl methylase / 3-demethylubiquinone-9 3-methyltransferase [Candidatus Tokpelaia sp. JSC188]|nr:MAG: 2-polyprenyl-6-hydroxyphenyl methylase / 3-demethylubiquinone-9 3-methyltransferase [Candidatus Tokpelaia sp. JSC188]